MFLVIKLMDCINCISGQRLHFLPLSQKFCKIQRVTSPPDYLTYNPQAQVCKHLCDYHNFTQSSCQL